MRNISTEWYVRDHIYDLINTNILQIAKNITDLDLDDEDSQVVLEQAGKLIDLTDFTNEEKNHLVEWTQLHCCLNLAEDVGALNLIESLLNSIDRPAKRV